MENKFFTGCRNALILSVLFWFAVYAAAAHAATVSLTVDASHYKGKQALFIDQGPLVLSTVGVGIDHKVLVRGRFSMQFGVFEQFKLEPGMQAHANFITTFRYRRFILRHISHTLISPGRANLGYNFLGLEFPL